MNRDGSPARIGSGEDFVECAPSDVGKRKDVSGLFGGMRHHAASCGIMCHHVASRGLGLEDWRGESLGDTWHSSGVPKNTMAEVRFLSAFGDFQWFESFFYRFSISIISIAVLSPWVSSPISIRHRLCALPRVLHALWCHWSPWSASGSGMSLPWCHASWSLCALVDPLTI